nr:phospholipase D-like domain-containing protein [Planococcus glaciei]
MDALKEAANRGVDVRMILDPNENAFGTEKTGLPNRPVVNEMYEEANGNLKVRWYNTTKSQFHTKIHHDQHQKRADYYGRIGELHGTHTG